LGQVDDGGESLERATQVVRWATSWVLVSALLGLGVSGWSLLIGGTWHFAALAALNLAMLVVVALAASGAASRPALRLQLSYAAMMTVALLGAPLVDNPHSASGVAVVLLVLVSAPRVLTRERTDRWVYGAVCVGLALSASELVDLPTRVEPVGGGDRWLYAASLLSIAGMLALALHERRRLPVRTKLILTLLTLCVTPLVVVVLDGVVVGRAKALADARDQLGRRAAAHAAAWDAYLLDRGAALARVAAAAPLRSACAGEAAADEALADAARGLGAYGFSLHVGGAARGDGALEGVALRVVDPAHGSEIVIGAAVPTESGGCSLKMSLGPGMVRAWARALAASSASSVLLRDREGATIIAAGPAIEVDLPHELGSARASASPTVASARIFEDERQIVAVAELPLVGWSLALMQRRAQLLRPVEAQARRHHAFALLTAAVVSLVSLWIGARIVGPLARLTKNLTRFTAGDAEIRTEVDSTDEFGELASRFNAMAEQVGELLSSLAEQASRLRGEVADRTQQEVALQALNEELSEARDQALAANRAKSAFLARMSHELRTPLNAVIGYGELIQEVALEGDGGAALVEIAADADAIVRSARHLLELINDVLDLSKIEAGRMDLHIEEFDAIELVKDVAAVVQPLVERQANRLILDLDGVRALIQSDRTKLRQCLLNLLSNAAKFTERGAITMTVRHDAVGALPLIIFTVSDTGIGISEEQQRRLFHAFTQVDNELTRRHSGTGLGLVITQRICRKLGGEITVSSAEGRGTAFTIRLPLRFARSADSMTWGLSSSSSSSWSS
jgi:signal transduction histidine kinase